MLEFAKLIHQIFGVSSPRVFVAGFALVGLVIFGGVGWLIDKGYRMQLAKESLRSAKPEQTIVNTFPVVSPVLAEKLDMSSPDDLKIRIVSGANSNATGDGLILYFINGRDDPIQQSTITVIDASSFNSRTSRFRTTENYVAVPIGSYLKTPAGDTAKQLPDRESAWLIRIAGDHLELSGNVGQVLKWPAGDPSTREIWMLTLSVQTKAHPAWNPKLRVEWERGSKKIFISPL